MPPETTLLAERIESVQNDIRDMKTSLSTMANALNKLAVVEERQTNAAQAQERAFAEITKLQGQNGALAERIRQLETANVETKGKNIWVDRAITGIVFLAGWLLAKATGLIK